MRISTVAILAVAGVVTVLRGDRFTGQWWPGPGGHGDRRDPDVAANLFYGIATTTGVLSLVQCSA